LSDDKSGTTVVLDGCGDNTNKAQTDNLIETIALRINIESVDNFVMMFDGGSRGNPGPSGCGYVIYNSAYRIVCEGSESLGTQTNNYAEYMGLILGLKKSCELDIKNLIIKGDSLLIINQLNGTFSVKSDNLKPLYNEAKKSLLNFENVQYIHVKRNNNAAADELANRAMDEAED
jgi:ribonuclease HI